MSAEDRAAMREEASDLDAWISVYSGEIIALLDELDAKDAEVHWLREQVALSKMALKDRDGLAAIINELIELRRRDTVAANDTDAHDEAPKPSDSRGNPQNRHASPDDGGTK